MLPPFVIQFRDGSFTRSAAVNAGAATGCASALEATAIARLAPSASLAPRGIDTGILGPPLFSGGYTLRPHRGDARLARPEAVGAPWAGDSGKECGVSDDSPRSVPFDAHVELLRVFLAHRYEVVGRVEGLLNAQRRPPEYLHDRSLLARHFEDCFFTLPAVSAGPA